MRKLFLLLVIFFYGINFVYAEDNSTVSNNNTAKATASTETPSQMLDFDLASYGEGGKKAWEIKGESADMLTDVVKLSNIVANLYGKEENMNLKADKGDYDKSNGKIHLEKNVVATTTSGAKLTTDSLDWSQKDQKITTNDIVNIQKENLEATGKGAQAEPALKKIFLKEEVKVDILEKEKEGKDSKETGPKEKIAGPSKTTITCDGPLEIEYEKGMAVFNNNVLARNPEQGDIYCDTMTMYFKFKEKQIDKVICHGNVKIVKGENVTTSQEAVYDSKEGKMTLTGRPQLIIFSEEGAGFGAAFGDKKPK